jgi:putative endonuclease
MRMRGESSLGTRKQEGARGEAIAARFLEQRGMKIIARNYRYDRGEIDLIADDHGELVFVEVKSRRSRAYGDPEESITPQKEEQLYKVAEGYQAEHHMEDHPCRFDVIAIVSDGARTEIRHIVNALG